VASGRAGPRFAATHPAATPLAVRLLVAALLLGATVHAARVRAARPRAARPPAAGPRAALLRAPRLVETARAARLLAVTVNEVAPAVVLNLDPAARRCAAVAPGRLPDRIPSAPMLAPELAAVRAGGPMGLARVRPGPVTVRSGVTTATIVGQASALHAEPARLAVTNGRPRAGVATPSARADVVPAAPVLRPAVRLALVLRRSHARAARSAIRTSRGCRTTSM
jgi:hypothetical protein